MLAFEASPLFMLARIKAAWRECFVVAVLFELHMAFGSQRAEE